MNENLSDRIYGTETEYGVYWKKDRKLAEVIKESDIAKFSSLKTEYSGDLFLFNGGMFKLDNSEGTPEYATPECRSVKDAVCWEKAGEKIVCNLVNPGGINDGILSLIKLGCGLDKSQNSSENEWVTAGHHENYLMHMDIANLKGTFHKPGERQSMLLITFLVSRVILAGCGWFVQHRIYDYEKYKDLKINYQISPRSDFIGAEISSSSNTSGPSGRSIINTKAETEGEALSKNFSRLHLILGDHLMSEISLFLTLGTTGLVLRMIESGWLKEAPIFKSPIESIKMFSCDPFLKVRVPLENDVGGLSESATAVEVLRFYYEKASDFVCEQGASKEEEDILYLWEDAIIKFETDFRRLRGQLDWVTKFCMIEDFLRKENTDWQKLADKSLNEDIFKNLAGKCKGRDQAYHYITSSGIYNQLKSRRLIKRILTDEDIENAVYRSPQNTRARIRSEFLKLLAQSHHISYYDKPTAEWTKIKWGMGSSQVIVNLDNPFDSDLGYWNIIKHDIK